MGERWVTLKLVEDETLRCESCSSYLHDQKVHLYLEVDDELVEILCDTCWKKEEAKG
jgi:hypothetical protein